MREQLLRIIEKNSRIDLKELAVILGVEEAYLMLKNHTAYQQYSLLKVLQV